MRYSSSMILTLLLMLGLVSGCGGGAADKPKVVKVTGTLTYKSKPVANAQVSFNMEGAPRAAVGITDTNGKFTLGTFSSSDGAVPGEHTVTVTKAAPQSATVNAPPSPEELLKKTAEMQKGNTAEGAADIPAKYSSPTTTPLKLKVSETDANDIPIELTD